MSSQLEPPPNLPFDPPSLDDLKEHIWPKYELREELDFGGSGLVYIGEKVAGGIPVAVKLIKADLGDELVQRFRREAKAMAALSHPNIVGVYDFGQITIGEEEYFYYSMDYVEGEDLGMMMDRKFSPQRVVNIICQICDALSYAHSKGVIHRDVKPPNILVDTNTGNEEVKVADFGLVKLFGPMADSFLTRSGTVLGTQGYVAPEIWNEETVDHRSDIYSVGVIAYQMLTGKVPSGDFEPVAKLVPEAGKRLSDAVERALACEPDHRYLSASHFAADLRQVMVNSKSKVDQPNGWYFYGMGGAGLLLLIYFVVKMFG